MTKRYGQRPAFLSRHWLILLSIIALAPSALFLVGTVLVTERFAALVVPLMEHSRSFSRIIVSLVLGGPLSASVCGVALLPTYWRSGSRLYGLMLAVGGVALSLATLLGLMALTCKYGSDCGYPVG